MTQDAASIQQLLRAGRDVEAALSLAADGQADRQWLVTIHAGSPQPMARVLAACGLARGQASPEPWLALASTALAANDYRTAASAFLAVAERSSDARGPRFEAARAAYLDNNLDLAERLYRTFNTANPVIAHELAETLIAQGRSEEALQTVQGASDLNRSVALQALSLRLRPGSQGVKALTDVANDRDASDNDRRVAAFALAGHFDRSGYPEEAMAWADMANAIAKTVSDWSPERDHRIADTMLAVHDELKAAGGVHNIAPRPIVIVGMPRSGTSLVESLLSAHPDVAAGGERTDLAIIGREIEVAAAVHGVDAAARLLETRAEAMSELVTDRLRKAGIAGVAYTDKLPLNSLYVGVIARTFPDALFIHLRRDPRETALSMYLLDFASAYPYASDFGDLADAIRLNQRLMTEWAARLHSRILTIDLESLVANPVDQGQRLFRFCGLDWTPDYLSADRRVSPMRTFSALQVRRPIKPAPPRWPRYRSWIQPLLDEFGDGELPRPTRSSAEKLA